jgi:hypothetical protein
MKTRKTRARQWKRYLSRLENMDSEVQVDYMGWLRQGNTAQRDIWRKFRRRQRIYLCKGF